MIFGQPVTTSANIFIPVTYPTQTYLGSFAQPLPTIMGTIFDVSYNTISGGETGARILNTTTTKPFDYRYVRPLVTDTNFTNFTYPLQGIVLSKNDNTVDVPSLKTFKKTDGSTELVWSINYKISGITGPQGSITGYYKNFSSTLIPKTISFDTFSIGSPPSADAYYTFNSSSSSQISLNIYSPTKTNTDDESGIIISSYTYKYTTTGSTISYNNGPAQTGSDTVVNYSSSQQTQLFTGLLYPDSVYTFSLKTTNSLPLTSENTVFPLSRGGTIYNNTFTTSYLPQSISTSSTNVTNVTYTFSPVLIQAKIVPTNTSITNTSITNLINNSTSSPVKVSNSNAVSVQYNETCRGTGKTKLMNIESTWNNDGTTYAAAKDFDGFPLAISGNENNSEVTFGYGATQDQFTETGLTGFYSKLSSFSSEITNSRLTPSSTQKSLVFTQNYYYPNGTVAQTYTTTHNFYYDTLTGVPSINRTAGQTIFSLNTSMTNVSGVSILGVNPTFTVTTKVSNLFKFFYLYENLLSYVFTSGSGATGTINETDLSKCGTPIPTTGGEVTFTNASVTATISPTFNTAINLAITAQNFNGNDVYNLSPLSLIVDTPSYNLINNSTKTPTSIQNISLSSASAGRRIWSPPGQNVSTTSYLPPMYGYNNNEISYATFPYDHNWSLVSTSNSYTTYNNINATQELQVFNGLYQSKPTGSSIVGYVDYSIYLNNSINYSTISTSATNVATNNYRFATFVWNYNGDISSTVNNFVFKLINFKYNGATPTISKNDTTGVTTVSGALNRIFVHYRAEQHNNNNNNIVPSSANLSTVWVDGNSKMGTKLTNGSAVLSSDIAIPASITSGNYYDDNSKTEVKAPTALDWTMIDNDLSIKVSSILFGASTIQRYIYCRIGLPMNANYSFEYVTLQVI